MIKNLSKTILLMQKIILLPKIIHSRSVNSKKSRQNWLFLAVCRLSGSYDLLKIKVIINNMASTLFIIFFFCVSKQIHPYQLRVKKLQVLTIQIRLPDLRSSRNHFRLSWIYLLYHLSFLQMSCFSLQVP